MDAGEWERELAEVQEELATHGFRFDPTSPLSWSDRYDAAWLCIGILEGLRLRDEAEPRVDLDELHARAMVLRSAATQRVSEYPSR